MYTHFDSFAGATGTSIQDHVPEAGGTWTAVNATPPTGIIIDSRGGAQTLTAATNDFQMANPLKATSWTLQMNFTTYASSSTALFGIIAAPSSAYPSFVFLNYQPASSQIELATSGHSTTVTANLNDGLPHTLALQYEQDFTGNPVAYAILDGTTLTSINLGLPTGTLYPFLRMTAGAGGSTPSLMQQIIATDNNQPPVKPVGFLNPEMQCFAQWTPATLSSQAALTFELPARNIVLKGIWAINAVPWLQQTTPAELQFFG